MIAWYYCLEKLKTFIRHGWKISFPWKFTLFHKVLRFTQHHQCLHIRALYLTSHGFTKQWRNFMLWRLKIWKSIDQRIYRPRLVSYLVHSAFDISYTNDTNAVRVPAAWYILPLAKRCRWKKRVFLLAGAVRPDPLQTYTSTDAEFRWDRGGLVSGGSRVDSKVRQLVQRHNQRLRLFRSIQDYDNIHTLHRYFQSTCEPFNEFLMILLALFNPKISTCACYEKLQRGSIWRISQISQVFV